MEIITKCALAALSVSAISLTVKKTNPELAVLISIMLSVLILTAASGLLEMFNELIHCARNMMGVSGTVIQALLKCIGISFLGKFSADLCRDASQSSAASALEFTATICAAAVSMPIIISMMKMIGTML